MSGMIQEEGVRDGGLWQNLMEEGLVSGPTLSAHSIHSKLDPATRSTCFRREEDRWDVTPVKFSSILSLTGLVKVRS